MIGISSQVEMLETGTNSLVTSALAVCNMIRPLHMKDGVVSGDEGLSGAKVGPESGPDAQTVYQRLFHFGSRIMMLSFTRMRWNRPELEREARVLRSMVCLCMSMRMVERRFDRR